MSSIGVMREGPLHAAIKAILAQPGDRLEVPAGRFVMDLVRADGELVEVQTGGFGGLGKKPDQLLDEHRVRIMHPVAAERRIARVAEDGEVASVRQSPKHPTALAVFDKLVAFPSLLFHPNLTLEVLLLHEDHVRAGRPLAARRRTREPGERRLIDVLIVSRCPPPPAHRRRGLNPAPPAITPPNHVTPATTAYPAQELRDSLATSGSPGSTPVIAASDGMPKGSATPASAPLPMPRAPA